MGIKVFSITQTLLRNTFVLVPPVSEQQAIAKYLDTVCPEIDSIMYDLEIQIETAMYGKGIDECNTFLENVGVETLGTKQRL